MTDSDERLQQVEEHIDQARKLAEEGGTLPDETPEPTLADPDADGEVEGDDVAPPG